MIKIYEDDIGKTLKIVMEDGKNVSVYEGVLLVYDKSISTILLREKRYNNRIIIPLKSIIKGEIISEEGYNEQY